MHFLAVLEHLSTIITLFWCVFVNVQEILIEDGLQMRNAKSLDVFFYFLFQCAHDGNIPTNRLILQFVKLSSA